MSWCAFLRCNGLLACSHARCAPEQVCKCLGPHQKLSTRADAIESSCWMSRTRRARDEGPAARVGRGVAAQPVDALQQPPPDAQRPRALARVQRIRRAVLGDPLAPRPARGLQIPHRCPRRAAPSPALGVWSLVRVRLWRWLRPLQCQAPSVSHPDGLLLPRGPVDHCLAPGQRRP
eukprot:1094482-Rhodomonas_salina.1